MFKQTTSENAPSFEEIEQYCGRAFYKIPRALQIVRAWKELRPIDLDILSVYWACENRTTPRQPTYAEIEANLGHKERSARNSVNRLVDKGLLIRPDGWKPGMKNNYQINRARVWEIIQEAVPKYSAAIEDHKAAISTTRRDAVNVRWNKVREKMRNGTEATPEEFEAMLAGDEGVGADEGEETLIDLDQLVQIISNGMDL